MTLGWAKSSLIRHQMPKEKRKILKSRQSKNPLFYYRCYHPENEKTAHGIREDKA